MPRFTKLLTVFALRAGGQPAPAGPNFSGSVNLAPLRHSFVLRGAELVFIIGPTRQRGAELWRQKLEFKATVVAAQADRAIEG